MRNGYTKYTQINRPSHVTVVHVVLAPDGWCDKWDASVQLEESTRVELLRFMVLPLLGWVLYPLILFRGYGGPTTLVLLEHAFDQPHLWQQKCDHCPLPLHELCCHDLDCGWLP